MRELDGLRLTQALQLAERSIGLSDPNPRVGCVIGRETGEVLGHGFTQRAGDAHAEVMALRDAAAQGVSVAGATAWVTLEPCAHQGRTPPCTQALIGAGIARVVVALTDPFPQVAGRGIEQLRTAGIEVVVATGAITQSARELNVGFLSRCERQRPWVRLKVAASIDGRTALADGSSQWLTGESARADVHAWRRRAAAVVTGIGTVLRDDPRMDVRLVPTSLQPLRVILDSRLRTPTTARILEPPGAALIVASAIAVASCARHDIECVALSREAEGHERPSIRAVLEELNRRDVNEVHVEAGATLNGAWMGGGWVDELLLYLAPTLLGPGRPIAELPPLNGLAEASRWTLLEASAFGADLRLRYRPAPAAGDQGCRNS